MKETIEICKKLNNQGFSLTLDILGEHTETPDEATDITNQYQDLLKIIKENNIDSNISIKPTHIGNDLGRKVFEENLFSFFNHWIQPANNLLTLNFCNSLYSFTMFTEYFYKK